jgi:formyl-CoA transferase
VTGLAGGIGHSQGPLHGCLILDFTRVLAGPFCTMVLGDLGAGVIKIEEPTSGDHSRAWGPPFVGTQSAYFLGINRNKESVAIDLTDERGRRVVHDLAQRADVLIENFRVGTMEAWGLGYDDLHRSNPALVYCSITGFGRTGPYKDLPGYDTIIEALGGLMSITGPPNGPPYKVGVALIDVVTGLYCSTAILAALHSRRSEGLGQRIDVSLLDVGLASLINVASAYLTSGIAPVRYGNDHPNIAPFGLLASEDGHIMLGVGNDQQWERFCTVVGLPRLADDPRFATNADRVSNRAQLAATLEPVMKSRSSERWFAELMNAGVPAAPVLSVEQALTSEHVTSTGIIQSISDAKFGEIKFVGSPLRLSETPVGITQPPPLLGEHTVDVLRDVVSYSEAHINALLEAGVIRALAARAPGASSEPEA